MALMDARDPMPDLDTLLQLIRSRQQGGRGWLNSPNNQQWLNRWQGWQNTSDPFQRLLMSQQGSPVDVTSQEGIDLSNQSRWANPDMASHLRNYYWLRSRGN